MRSNVNQSKAPETSKKAHRDTIRAKVEARHGGHGVIGGRQAWARGHDAVKSEGPINDQRRDNRETRTSHKQQCGQQA